MQSERGIVGESAERSGMLELSFLAAGCNRIAGVQSSQHVSFAELIGRPAVSAFPGVVAKTGGCRCGNARAYVVCGKGGRAHATGNEISYSLPAPHSPQSAPLGRPSCSGLQHAFAAPGPGGASTRDQRVD